MKLFAQIVRTTVNIAMLPVAAVKDIVTLGGAMTGKPKSEVVSQLEKIKDEASE